MKKIIVLFIFLCPSFAFAQFSKGQVFLGGSLTASSSSNHDNTSTFITNPSKSNSLSISPVFGYFLNPKLAIGGSIGYSTSLRQSDFVNTYYDDNNNPISVNAFTKTVTHGISVGSFSRYYLPISNSFYFAAHGEFRFNRANSTNTNFNNGGALNQESTDKNPSYTLSATIKPVFIFFPSPKWGIEASVGSLGYSYQRYLPDVSSSSSFSLSAGSFSFGFAYYFAKK